MRDVFEEYESENCECEDATEETGYRCVNCGSMICEKCWDAMNLCGQCYWNEMDNEA